MARRRRVSFTSREPFAYVLVDQGVLSGFSQSLERTNMRGPDLYTTLPVPLVETRGIQERLQERRRSILSQMLSRLKVRRKQLISAPQTKLRERSNTSFI